MASTDATPSPKNGAAYRWYFPIVSTLTRLGITGASGIVCKVSKDGAPSATSTNSVVEVDNGGYYLDLTSTEMTCDNVFLAVTSTSTNAATTFDSIATQSAGKISVDIETISGNGIDINASQLGVNIAGIGGDSVVCTSGKLWVLDSSGNPVAPASTALTAAQVWDLTFAGHNTTGTFGHLMQTMPSTDDVVDSVWQAMFADYASDTGSFGLAIGSLISGVNVSKWGTTSVTSTLPMATYTQPTGFLSANFSTGVAVSPSSVRTAVGMASANLDDQLSTILNASGGGGGGGGLSGPSPVKIYFKDSAGNPVPLVEFLVEAQGVGRSDTSGVAQFGLTDGAYFVQAQAKGVILPRTSMTVSGTTTLTVIAFAALPPNPILTLPPASGQTSW